MRRILVFAAVLMILLVVPSLAAAQGESRKAAINIPFTKTTVERGTNARFNVSIYSSEDQWVVLTATPKAMVSFDLNNSRLFLEKGDPVVVQVLVSVPNDDDARSFDIVLEVYRLDEESDLMSIDPIDSRRIYVQVTGQASEEMDLLFPILAGIFVFLELLGIAFLIYTRKRKFKDFQLRDVFVIYKDGRLIKHITTHREESLDHFTVSSMLTAISNYISDSFKSDKDSGRYGELKYGDVRVLVEHGKNVNLAVVVSGEHPPKLKRIMSRTLSDIEGRYALKKWDGDYSLFVNFNELMSPLVTMHKGPGFFQRRRDRLEAPILEERTKRVGEMGKRMIATGIFPDESQDELIAYLNTLDNTQLESFDSLMGLAQGHLSVDGKKVLYVEVPELKKN